MVLTALGGSGEKGRVGFLLEGHGKKVVLDYGIKRRLSGKKQDIYPLETVGKVDALYLSHAHQDHTGAVPLLEFKNLLCSKPTLSLIKHYVSTWFKTAKNYGLFIEEERYRKFLERDHKISDMNFTEAITFEMGKSGHLVGSTWVRIEWDGFSLLYTGDMTLDSPMNRFDQLKKADILIVDVAYGTKILPPREGILNLLDSLKGNRIILPLPSVGRSQEILYTLLQNKIVPVFVDEKILKGFKILKDYRDWLKVNPEIPQLNAKIPDKFTDGIYLTTDSMITGGTSLRLYDYLKNDGKTYFVLTGHQEEGTPGWKMLRERNEKSLEFIWKVHPDFNDVLKIIDAVKPSYTILFHANRETSLEVIKELKKIGIKSFILEKGNSLILEEII